MECEKIINENNLQDFIVAFLNAVKHEGNEEITEWDRVAAILDCTRFFHKNKMYFL